MASEARPRAHPWVNPEHATAILRRIVEAANRPHIDLRRQRELDTAIEDARQLLAMKGPR